MPSETALAPTRNLFDIEDDYQALLETEALVEPEQQEKFKQELAHALKTAVDKRERFAQFILACERRKDALKAETKRLMDQAATYERAADKAREYGASVIESLGTDAKGKYKKLEGNTVVLSLRPAVPHVEFTDEAAVGSEYKTLTITVPARAWESHMELCWDLQGGIRPAILDQISRVEVTISKKYVREAIENGIEVSGADLRWGSPSLLIR